VNERPEALAALELREAVAQEEPCGWVIEPETARETCPCGRPAVARGLCAMHYARLRARWRKS
jgi:hypothetical protein